MFLFINVLYYELRPIAFRACIPPTLNMTEFLDLLLSDLAHCISGGAAARWRPQTAMAGVANEAKKAANIVNAGKAEAYYG